MEKYLTKLNNEDLPKYIQIAKHIKRLIDTNIIEDGEKLPSIRKLSKFLEVNNDTIINVYNRLEAEGYAMIKIGSGTYAKKREYTKIFKKDSNASLETFHFFSLTLNSLRSTGFDLAL